MHSRPTDEWQPAHGFGQTVRRPVERRVHAVIALTIVTMIAEVVAGWLTGSMALLADGLHMGTHAFALGLAALAYILTRARALDRRYSFGSGKIGELAGFASALLLGVSALVIAGEAVARLFDPRPIAYGDAIMVAVIGLIVNLASAALLGLDHHHGHDDGHDHHHDHHHGHGHGHGLDTNARAALLHVLADALTSLAAIAAVGLAWMTGWLWADPLAALLAAAVILKWSVDLGRQSAGVLLDRQAPEAMRREITAALESDGDSRVVDLHLWSVGHQAWTLVAAVVTHGDAGPDDYRARLPGRPDLHHPIIEVNRCLGDGPEHG
ncbi:MAG: cation transporter [Tistrella sp.]|uniref:Cation transporter n=1 Tax=Tistrella mobilis TaxID=171437 RepID=A0A3B9IFN3_9PROT|nr:CDF family Co(II)/Ni(II) efflux transporter DmeF [Tistrella sp.]MAD39327.1 cation transporter [Tistrella sp.]MBA76343.1 cation transporter [Tistrella sp.]HAE46652.1 cation transporter [Tistrella mobilis]